MTQNSFSSDRPIVIAGPCAAESYELMDEVAAAIKKLADELGFTFIFKASFDKANRTSISSYRGSGIEQTLEWFSELKKKYGFMVLTDIHESIQVPKIAEVCDVLQIPAFLCRQTDLLLAALSSGRYVNVKKGQFLDPDSMSSVVKKAESVGAKSRIFLTERGACFGYNNLVVDMRGFKQMSSNQVPLIFDITHSVQLLGGGSAQAGITGARREFAPLLARSATATGYLSGYFLEVHRNPAQAKSDAEAQLSIPQAQTLLRQLIPFWRSCSALAKIDAQFPSGI